MKPDWCPQDVWATTGMEFDELYEQEDALEGGCEHGIRVSMAKLVLQARSQAFEEVADLIDEGFERVVGELYRYDGKPSKNDKCTHGRYMYEDCEACCSQAIRQHSQKGRDTE